MQEFILFWMLFAGSGSQVGSQPRLDEAGCSKAASHMQERFRSASSFGARLETWCEQASEAGRK
jgi:hypothetical protein